MPYDNTVLVTGATGGQGGAVARRLLDDGWRVRALVRDPHTPAARDLGALGAELVTGDLDDPRSLRAAMRDAHGVFSVQAADLTAPHPEAEVRQGVNVAEAAAAAGVAHLVYSSVAAVGRATGVAHFASKAAIEARVAALALPATVLRPVFFMENWRFMVPEPRDGERVGTLALGPDTPLQMIALADIGRIAADAFARPDDTVGQTVAIAGDELTIRQIAEALTEADGIPTRFEHRPTARGPFAGGDMAAMFTWLEKEGYGVDVAALRGRYPGLLTFRDWLRTR
ncbi:NmrA/HSCARG family protein [Streptomyces sp. G45]|uniref:NmrA/HSCARG family protein n=1 Tax=Streptomyces sp. G45 TaxID=3406627 RepID=UPI003C135E32